MDNSRHDYGTRKCTLDAVLKIRILAVYKGVFSRSKTDVPVYNQNHSFFGQFIINLHAVLMCYENEHIFWTQKSK